MLLCGIEEAGRGPVIGPMVMCGVLIDEKDELKLVAVGARDSKLLSPRARELVYKKIIGLVKDYKVVAISPQEIDAAIQSPTLNLNWLEAKKTSEIVNYLKPDKVILDCPSSNCRAYADYVRKGLENKKVRIVAEHKADVNHPIVSAASIIAKVVRDQKIEGIKKEIGIDFGSGYPADERTAKFLREYHDKYPELFRKEWEPYRKIIKAKKQKGLAEFHVSKGL